MDTTLFQNILFATLSIFLIIVTAAVAVFIFYMVLVLKSLREFFDIIKKESEKIAQDIDAVRQKVKNAGATVASFIVQLLSFFKGREKRSKKN